MKQFDQSVTAESGQLTALRYSSVNITYNYSSTQNNGKITGQSDAISGEQLAYTYDALNRLASATTTAGTSWGQSYSYDGFGNLTDQTVTAGTSPSLHVVYNASTNRQTTDCADANGNINSLTNCSGGYGYDLSNRIVTVPGNTAYAYAPGNKRVWRGTTTSGHLSLDELTFWSVTGQKLATYTIQGGDPTIVYSPPGMDVVIATSNYYFGRKLIKNGNGYVGSDRLGSIGKFYPWGQEKPSATANGTEKFTGYFRDAETGLDYAKNRYHQPGMGRFMTPDPYLSSAGASDPGTWNRYAYVGGDPIRYRDPRGREECDPGDGDDSDCPSDCPVGYYWDDDIEQCVPEGGGGGPSPDPPQPSKPSKPYVPKCRPNDQVWINQNGAAAIAIAKALGDPTTGAAGMQAEANILALSAYESTWGQSNYSQQGAYFSLEEGVSGPNSTPSTTFAFSSGWSKPFQNSQGNWMVMAQYSSYLNAGLSFAQLYKNRLGGVTDPTQFGTLASQNGFGITVSTFTNIAADLAQCLNAAK